MLNQSLPPVSSRLLRLLVWCWFILAFLFSVRSIALARAPVALTAASFLISAFLFYSLLTGSFKGWPILVNRIQTVRSTTFWALVISVAIALRAVWSMWVQTEPYSDFAVYHQAALALSRGQPPPPDKPLGYPVLLAAWYWVGNETWPGYLLNILFSAGTVLVVYYLGNVVTGNGLVARFAALFAAFWPADILYSSVLGSEAAYAFFLWLACWLFLGALKAVGWSKPTRAALLVVAALVLAFSDSVRPTSLLLVMPALVLALLLEKNLDKRFRVAAGIGFIIVAVLGSQGLTRAGSLLAPEAASMPSQRWGYNFLIGTNNETWGRYNEDDVSLVSTLPGDVVKKNQAALQLGLQRIRSNPAAFLALLPKKFVVMWGDDTYGAHLSTAGAGRTMAASVTGYLYYLSQLYWCMILLLGLLYIWQPGRAIPSGLECLLILLILATLFFEVWEVQSRYHHFLNPVLAIIAALGLVSTLENKGEAVA